MTSNGGHAMLRVLQAQHLEATACLVTENLNANMSVSMTDYRPTISKKT